MKPNPNLNAARRHWKTLRRTPACVTLALGGAALILGGCRGGREAPPTSAAPAAPVPNAPVLTVNGTPITNAEFMHRLELASGPAILRRMTQEELLLQYAKAHGTAPAEADVEAKYAALAARPDFSRTLAASGQTPDDIKRDLRVQLAREAIVGKGVAVSEDEMRRYYALNTEKGAPHARFLQPETIQVAVIISPSTQDISNALRDLAAGGAFDQVARRYSRDKSARNGGLLPPIVLGRGGGKFPALQEKLQTLIPGGQIDTIQAGGAYWIVRCVGRTPARTLPYHTVRDACRAAILLSKGAAANGKAAQQDFSAFERAAEIRTSSPRYKDFAAH